MPACIEPTEEAVIALLRKRIEGPVVMLNLLRFRDEADYSHAPELAPDQPVSGRDAYLRYMRETQPIIEQTGAKLLFAGDAAPFLIGPSDEQWDMALLVEQASVDAFLSHAQNPAALAVLPHRTAALADSRLLPLVPQPR